MVKCIIFDYDGVISESVNVKTQAFAKIYECFGSDVVEQVVKHHLANGGVSRYNKIKLYIICHLFARRLGSSLAGSGAPARRRIT